MGRATSRGRPCVPARDRRLEERMFLLGGTAFSGKTLLAHLLNQGRVVCLDEPDFHDVAQKHRGIPLLRTLFPDRKFPDPPERSLTYIEAVALIKRCENVIRPSVLGMKTSNWVFIEYAKIYRASGYPVIGVIRDIRDVLAEGPLPEWIDGDPALNSAFRAVWKHVHLCDLLIRYEDLVTKPDSVLESISTLIGCDLTLAAGWNAEAVHKTMFKLDRHEMLRAGMISREQVGIWKRSGRAFSGDTHATAAMMGYEQ